MKLFAKYSYPNVGTDHDRRKNGEAGLAEGMKYAVEALRVGDWSSYVYLEDYFQKSFNTVNFEFYDEFGAVVDIYSDPRTRDFRQAGIYTLEEIQQRHIIRNISDAEAFALSMHDFEWHYLPGCNDVTIAGDEKTFLDAKHLLLAMNEEINKYSVQDLCGNVSHMCLTRTAAQCLRVAGCLVEYIGKANPEK